MGARGRPLWLGIASLGEGTRLKVVLGTGRLSLYTVFSTSTSVILYGLLLSEPSVYHTWYKSVLSIFFRGLNSARGPPRRISTGHVEYI